MLKRKVSSGLRGIEGVPKRIKESSPPVSPVVAATIPSPTTLPHRDPNIITVFSWNIENLVPYIQPPSTKPITAYFAPSRPKVPRHAPSLRNILHHFNYPDIFCLQEIRLRPKDTALILQAEQAANDPTSQIRYKCYTCLANDPLNVRFRGGRMYGVATYVRDSVPVTQARTVDWDKEGRVMIVEIGAKMAVVNVYAVNGTDKPYLDPITKKMRGTRHERKREFNRLLMAECLALKGRGLEILLIGDFNISLTKLDVHPRLRTEHPHALARQELTEVFITTLAVTDVFRMIHPVKRAFTWFLRGVEQGKDCARVDYALLSQGLAKRVIDADIEEDKEERFGSDHAPLYVTLKSPFVNM
ncbi:hypothetical protein SpCBS45565_g08033 [Spizellomyces sp. 'palustris']|nr:hypothetical protein SpCBS45565_g08033 [Spizellomyces sp. 'palustris']